MVLIQVAQALVLVVVAQETVRYLLPLVLRVVLL
jgi:hypothetical protein